MPATALPVFDAAEAVSPANGVQTTEGRVFTGLPYGCPKLDWRVRMPRAVAFVVTYRMEGLMLGKEAFSTETFSSLREAQDFHEEIAIGVRPGTAGVVIALRADGSVIGEVPTRRQEQAIIERSRNADLDYRLPVYSRRE